MNIRKNITSFLSLAVAAVLLAGCGGEPGTIATTPPPSAQEANQSGSVTITGGDQMQFDKTEFTVKAGSEVTLTFKNIGKMPKEAMGHNLVVLVKGTDPMAFATASTGHPKNDYVAPSMKDSVVASTRVLGPGESQTLTFTAPADVGDYPFICSFPGHTPAGMKGVMRVN